MASTVLTSLPRAASVTHDDENVMTTLGLRQKNDRMADDGLRLRTIVVSGSSALSKTRDRRQQQHIRGRMVELLGALEDSIMRDGADPDMLSSIRQVRTELRP